MKDIEDVQKMARKAERDIAEILMEILSQAEFTEFYMESTHESVRDENGREKVTDIDIKLKFTI